MAALDLVFRQGSLSQDVGPYSGLVQHNTMSLCGYTYPASSAVWTERSSTPCRPYAVHMERLDHYVLQGYDRKELSLHIYDLYGFCSTDRDHELDLV